MTHWHYAQLEIVPKDLMIKPQLSVPFDTHSEAHRAVWELLKRTAEETRSPQMRQLARNWRRGAKDDWIYLGLMQWALYECPDDCRAAAQSFLEDWAQTLKTSGLKWVQVPALPADWPAGHTEE